MKKLRKEILDRKLIRKKIEKRKPKLKDNATEEARSKEVKPFATVLYIQNFYLKDKIVICTVLHQNLQIDSDRGVEDGLIVVNNNIKD